MSKLRLRLAVSRLRADGDVWFELRDADGDAQWGGVTGDSGDCPVKIKRRRIKNREAERSWQPQGQDFCAGSDLQEARLRLQGGCEEQVKMGCRSGRRCLEALVGLDWSCGWLPQACSSAKGRNCVAVTGV
jgi:hypothetical protein